MLSTHLLSAALLAPAPVATCESLAALDLPGATITAAVSVPAGTSAFPGEEALPAFCRVSGRIKPSADSDIAFEVWMPAAGWDGRFTGVGNGGFGGSIGPREYATMARAVRRGRAAAATDTGHRGSPVDASWAAGHPEKVVDFGHRAIHEMTVKAKAVIAAFYGTPPHHSYFAACSNGGRQALMEAQRYPGDYDGILAGAPANFWTHLLAQAAWDTQAMLGDPAAYIPAGKLPAIEAAALSACDRLDGVADRVVDDPTRCAFDPAVLVCKGAESDACLTSAQAATLRKLYAGPRTPRGKVVHPGHVPGGETGPDGWALWLTGPAPGRSLESVYAHAFFRHMVFEKADWEVRAFDLQRDTAVADARLAAVLNATDPDLGPFRKRGGKLVVWHGWCDAAISPLNSIDYYRSVVARMGAAEAEAFVRLYMVPGLQHCADGPGPDGFLGASALRDDPGHDMLAALERWVEQGVAPGPIVAAKYRRASDPSSGVVRTRPLCPYPQVARWKGSGSTDEAASFACTGPGAAGPR
jgi:hypothetical protein